MKNQEFMDEEILELIKEKENRIIEEAEKERIAKEIRQGLVNIDDEKIGFQEKSLLEDQVKIFMPKSFEIMAPEIASVKYPYEKRPSLIFTDETTTKNITFNLLDHDMLEKEVEGFKESMKTVLLKMYSSAYSLGDGVEEINEKNIGYFEFINEAIDANIYNFMFCIELGGKALVCAINCPERDMVSWRLLAKGIMGTFKTKID